MDVMLYEHGIPVAACTTQDINTHGMYIITNMKFHMYATLLIEFPYPGIERTKIRIPATVVRIDDNGIGVELYTPEPWQKAAIKLASESKSPVAMAI
jgi:hypothetical protein